jgi:endoribonuclease LACTB2
VASPYTHQWYKLPEIIGSLPKDSFTPAGSDSPIHDLHDLQKISFSSSSPSSEPDADSNSLVVLHTPGHTTDSICLYIPSDRALYTADSVLGAGTAVFEDLSTYMSSLQRMLNFDSAGEKYTLVYPGHGPVLKDGKATISMYIKHRLEREAQILELLHKSPTPPSETSAGEVGKWTTWTLVTTIYASYPENLWLPAARGVELHLKKLEKDGVVKRGEGEDFHCTWELTGVSSKNE